MAINASEFKVRCFALIDQVDSGCGRQLEGLRNVTSPRPAQNAARRIDFARRGFILRVVSRQEEVLQFFAQMRLQALQNLEDRRFDPAVLASGPHRCQVHRNIHK